MFSFVWLGLRGEIMRFGKRITIRTLGLDDIHEIYRCLQITVSTLSNDLFVSPSLDYLVTIISGYGRTVGAFYENSLVGFASFVFPKRGKNNLGHLLQYDEKKLFSVVQFEHIYIVPKFRRLGIAEQLARYLLQHTDPQFTILLSTVSPQNTPSLALAFKIKQRITSYVEVYGVNRFVMRADLSIQERDCEQESFEVPREEINQLNQMLQRGYEGVALGSENKTFILISKAEKNETI